MVISRARIFSVFGYLVITAFTMSSTVYAHVVVRPNAATTASYEIFSVSVPNEKEQTTTMVKLVIPDDIESVTPTTKPGWTISLEKQGEGESARVRAITWSGQGIPAGQRDDFSFSAKTPSSPSKLEWKAYQTYEDGTTVSWDQADTASAKEDENGNTGPFSVTEVTEVAAGQKSEAIQDESLDSNKKAAGVALYVAMLGALTSLVAVALTLRKK